MLGVALFNTLAALRPHTAPLQLALLQMHTDEQMEQRLMKRLRQIERALMRDDEYRRIEVGAMRAATECVLHVPRCDALSVDVGACSAATPRHAPFDRHVCRPDELRALRNSPQLYYPEAMRIPPPAPVNREALSADR